MKRRPSARKPLNMGAIFEGKSAFSTALRFTLAMNMLPMTPFQLVWVSSVMA